jgi:surface polysaccharide O-acyltransferase-like enzyme
MTQTKERDSNLDFLRIMAFLLLVCCHAADPFNASATYGAGEADPHFAFWGAIWGSMVRSCVPLFVMLSGALLLPRPGDTKPMEMKRFYARRIPRVVWPFLIWSVAYYLTPWILGLLGGGADSVLFFFPFAENTDQSLAQAVSRIAVMPYNFSYLAGHMWYIYMLVGMYLYMPIFSAWVRSATRGQKKFVLAMWLLASLLPYFSEYVSRYSFGTCDWNQFGLFYYFAGFNGYLLLGHYIYVYVAPRLNLGKGLLLAAIFVAGYAVTFFGFRYIQSLDSPTPQQTELFWTYNTPNVIMMSTVLFLLLRTVKPRGKKLCALLQNFTLCGFGIYMLHYFFVGPAYGLSTLMGVPVALRIPVSALIILFATWAVVAVLGRALGKWRRIVLG